MKSVRRAIQYALTGVFGLFCGASAILYMLSTNEDSLLSGMVDRSTRPEWSEERKVVALTELTHRLMTPRLNYFKGEGKPTLRRTWLRTVDQDLVEAPGSCGSYTQVLARLLETAGIDFRVLQMYCDATKTWGCHILLEAKIDGRWRAVDPSYNLVFPVSARAVGQGWRNYKSMLPDGYQMIYRYDDVRYTNWDKVPVVLPAIRRVIALFSPEFASTFSVRSYLLNTYLVYSMISLGLAVVTLLAALALRKAKPFELPGFLPRHWRSARPRRVPEFQTGPRSEGAQHETPGRSGRE